MSWCDCFPDEMIRSLKKTGNCLRAIVGNASRTASSNIGKVMIPHRRKMTQATSNAAKMLQ
jgi:hypothetical protein